MSEAPNITVLYVDDEKNNLFLFEINFKKKYNVITALSAFEGLDKLEEFHKDIIVVISDMRMPKMNGIEFVRKAKEKFENIAYFILTGFDYDDEIDQALRENIIQKFFTKPFDVNEIDQAIQDAIANVKKSI